MSKEKIFDDIYSNHWYEWMFDEQIILNQEIDHLQTQINKHLDTIDKLRAKYKELECEYRALIQQQYGDQHAQN